MSDTEFVLLAVVAVVALAISAFTTVPERRNPHQQADQPKWWRRPPS